ncbi:hypothetical protein [Jeotgalibacillus soli]|uniref:Uncharacterized protein n=1 Tax=Jeotgalibacillus soli TaxID=889306 RepID=A0A0C2V7H6_9BACL|nr:hypothetical protein [Jeotgalibacillus soli]KIL44912.1 hypothetical protein KP78_24560 [Jeotgalibacillus soli]
MSLKLIELQVAIPKAVDAGKLASQQQEQNAVAQSQIAALAEKEIQKKRTSVIESAEGEKTTLGKFSGSSADQLNHQRQLSEKSESPPKNALHPFKGKRVDFSG